MLPLSNIGAPRAPGPSVLSFLGGGAVAGLVVDLTLYPVDTVKTRMQAPGGFSAARGFRGIYRGISSVIVGSAPGAATFFTVYETAKYQLEPYVQSELQKYLLAASMGEAMACLVRVPMDNVKSKMQAGLYNTTRQTCAGIMARGGFRGHFVGYLPTLAREVPFSATQFTLYETMKNTWSRANGTADVSPREAAVIGAVSGGFSAVVTTPLDVVKTRLMLGADSHGVAYRGFRDATARIYAEGGMATLFSGVVPRTMLISLGGVFFFGSYEYMKDLTKHL